MYKILKCISTGILGFSLLAGVGLSVSATNSNKETEAKGKSDWVKVTELNQLGAGDKILIGTNDGSSYLNETLSNKGHFQVTQFTDDNPISDSAPGVITLEEVPSQTNSYYFHGTTGYIYETKGTSGGGAIGDKEDDRYWKLSDNTGEYQTFAMIYNTTESNYLLSFNDSSFRTYTDPKNGDPLTLYKFIENKITSVSIKTNPTKTTYFAGEKFNPDGLIIAITYDRTKVTECPYIGNESHFEFTPNLDTALNTSDKSVEVKYDGVTSSNNISINVYEEVDYELTMYPNNGTDVPVVIKTSKVPDCSLTYTNHAFVRWNTSADGSGTDVPVGTLLTGPKTIYAIWDKSNSTREDPYTVDEALNAIDKKYNLDKEQYVEGKICSIDAYNEEDHTLTYCISTDGTKADKYLLKIKHGRNIGNTDFSGMEDLDIGADIIIFGFLEKEDYSHQFRENSYIVSMKLVTSFTVKNNPTKLYYNSGETFDPSGLVITATYDDGSVDDIAYSNDTAAKFSFSPTKITESGNVTITYKNKTATIGVYLLIVTNVDSVASAPTEVYLNDSIPASDVILNVSLNDGSNKTVEADLVSCDTSTLGETTATATYNASTGKKTADFTITVVSRPVYDYVTDTLTVEDTGATSTSYVNWSNVKKTSGAVYAGNSSNQTNGSIGLRQAADKPASGIIVTSSNGVATKVNVSWSSTTNKRFVRIKGQDVPYTSVQHAGDLPGEVIGEISYDSKQTETKLSKEYKYIAIYSTDGSLALNNISITWKVPGANNPLVENPTLSIGKEATLMVGKKLIIDVTTNPVDSDETLLPSTGDANIVTIKGSSRKFEITGVKVGETTITIAGAKGVYKATATITVTEAVKTFEDKVLTPDKLDITSYETTETAHSYDGVNFITKNVMKQNGFQFKKDSGYLYNDDLLYTNGVIKSITLIMSSGNVDTPIVYEGTLKNPTENEVSASPSHGEYDVRTYLFNGSSTFFRIQSSSSATLNIEKVIIELADSADEVLSEARLAARTILTKLNGLCGAHASGTVTQAQWDDLNEALADLSLSSDAKAFLKSSERVLLDDLSQGSVEIGNAMAHYDACVEKFGFKPDINLTNATPSSSPMVSSLDIQSSNIIALIAIVSVVIFTTAGLYFLIRKRKENN
ncbi:MAG: bacterial Ig-like domain-containing protein [Bacilli bacterium]|nr:bacterial Ig-like domain-containing protein [Bacilli bacterium]